MSSSEEKCRTSPFISFKNLCFEGLLGGGNHGVGFLQMKKAGFSSLVVPNKMMRTASSKVMRTTKMMRTTSKMMKTTTKMIRATSTTSTLDLIFLICIFLKASLSLSYLMEVDALRLRLSRSGLQQFSSSGGTSSSDWSYILQERSRSQQGVFRNAFRERESAQQRLAANQQQHPSADQLLSQHQQHQQNQWSHQQQAATQSMYQPQNQLQQQDAGQSYQPQTGQSYQPQTGQSYQQREQGQSYQPQTGQLYQQQGQSYQQQKGPAYQGQAGHATYQPKNQFHQQDAGKFYQQQQGQSYPPQTGQSYPQQGVQSTYQQQAVQSTYQQEAGHATYQQQSHLYQQQAGPSYQQQAGSSYQAQPKAQTIQQTMDASQRADSGASLLSINKMDLNLPPPPATWWELPPHLKMLFAADMNAHAGYRGQAGDAKISAERAERVANIFEPSGPRIAQELGSKGKFTMNIGTAEAAVAPDREKDEPKDGPLLLLSAKKPESPSTQQPSVAKADAQEADDFFLVDETDHVEANAYFEAAVEEEMWDSMATEYLTRLKTKSLRHEEVKRQLKKRYERMRQQGMENFRNNAPLYREATERISREIREARARANAQSTTLVSSALSTASGSPTGTAASYLGNAVGQAFGGVGAVGQALSSGWADPRSFTAQLTSSAAVQKLVANARDRKCAPPSMPAPFS